MVISVNQKKAYKGLPAESILEMPCKKKIKNEVIKNKKLINLIIKYFSSITATLIRCVK